MIILVLGGQDEQVDPCNICGLEIAHEASTILKELQATLTEENWKNSVHEECLILKISMYVYESETTEPVVTILYANLQCWTM